jgi:Zn finger protein HypA/HybF involved in hydrogenase expression
MGKLLTTKEFIEKAIAIHGNEYDYSKVEYINAKTKVIIICPKHGEFLQAPDPHLSLCQGCPKCGQEINKLKKTKEKFIREAELVHGNKYNYNRANYIGARDKIEIYCNTHKEYFWQIAGSHISGHGCSKCSTEITHNKQRSTFKDFIEKAILVHGNKYDYSKVCDQ